MLALKIHTDPKPANHHCGIAAIKLLARNVLFDFFLARTRNLLYAVVRKGEGCNNGLEICFEGKAIILAQQFFALQKRIFLEELVEVVITATKGPTSVSLIPCIKAESALVLKKTQALAS